MNLYSQNDSYELYQGNMLDMLEIIEPNTIDSIVTDPPYELNFMSKGWDNAGISFQKETWQKCYEVLKPGGYLLAFGGSRTFHRIACAIEDAGFEIRDAIMWLYGSGFPKSMDISKQIDKRANRSYENLNLFGKKLKEQRELKGYSKNDIDKMMGTNTSYAWWEGRNYLGEFKIQLPDKENYKKLKEILELNDDMDFIFEGAEREVIGTKQSGCFNSQEKDRYTIGSSKSLEVDITIPSTDLAKQWQGWGTALKPSYESIIIAQKPYSIEIYLLIGILDILNEVIDKCQLNLNANIVEKISKLNQAKQSVEENIVLNNAESKMFTKKDLLEVMDMLQSTLTENTNLNTELLCLNFLVEICNQMSKYTTETKINLITELKILKLLVVENILKNTMEENKIKQLGMKQNALTVEEFLKEEKLKLNYINILSAQDNAILKEEESSLHPKLNQIIVARKPFKGSLVDNVIEYGVGGINIDECRVAFNGDKWNNQKSGATAKAFNLNEQQREAGTGVLAGYECKANDNGRFPANTILTYDETDFDEVCGGFPDTKGGKRHNTVIRLEDSTSYGGKAGSVNTRNEFNDSGSASRYFMNCKYTGKDEEIWKQLLVNNVENNLEILKATKGNIAQMNVEDLLKELKDHYAKYVGNQLDLIETPIVQDIVEILTWDFKIGTSQVIQDFIINSKKCIQFLNLVQFVEKMDNIDTTQTTQNLLKLFGYVKVVITNYIQGSIEYDQKRYIYTPKASKKDRDEGLDDFNESKVNDGRQTPIDNAFQRGETPRRNVHPTVKPTELMQYLVRLVTPNGGTILDPFNGSGSTGKAVMYENKECNKNYKYIGIELTEEYLPIAKARIEYACKLTEEEKVKERQMSIYDI